jgi:hypothetical protein
LNDEAKTIFERVGRESDQDATVGQLAVVLLPKMQPNKQRMVEAEAARIQAYR